MMMILKAGRYTLFGVVLLSISCASGKTSFSGFNEYLSYGTIGGVQPSYQEYRIYKNGSLRKYDTRNREGIVMLSFSEQQTKQFYELIKNIADTGFSINESSGNQTYFIKLVKDKEEIVSFVWSDASNTISELEYIHVLLIKVSIDRFHKM